MAFPTSLVVVGVVAGSQTRYSTALHGRAAQMQESQRFFGLLRVCPLVLSRLTFFLVLSRLTFLFVLRRLTFLVLSRLTFRIEPAHIEPAQFLRSHRWDACVSHFSCRPAASISPQPLFTRAFTPRSAWRDSPLHGCPLHFERHSRSLRDQN